MSRTLRDNYKGEKTAYDWSKKRLQKTKFFGHTSGAHSHDLMEIPTPIKGIDFIKYGWPSCSYPKNLYKAKKGK